ncbi:acyltransferase [Patulibacter brassicae]|jgi:peptidoglycan/LPS O-acetylase OafA/YrhL|uniref:Acyltransferase n=1 Tax=Patulibacter brassicae TaxID=1705717 RepID=A0ABU4VHS5_9ACTN|nr:acyltransferase [Patulibacter brassicae]MDX8151376.1 acyltransferase [Patulibacter brassicae]
MPAARTSSSPRATPSSDVRWGALDGLRGVAAIGVVLVHVWMFVRGDTPAPRGTLDDVISQLRLGMPMFFVLSGFLIFRPFAAALIDGRPLPQLGRYALRRGARVLPAYWLAIAATALLLLHLDHPMAVATSELPRYFAFLQNYSEATAGRLNPPSWTIAVEASFYVAVPVLGLLAARLVRRCSTPGGRRAVLAAACVALAVAGSAWLGWATLTGAGKTWSDTLPGRMGSFGAGMAVAVLVHGRRLSPRGAGALALAGVALVVAEAVVHGAMLGPRELRQATLDSVASTGFGLLIAAIALGRVHGTGILARGPLQWTGTVSYGLYLAHFPVIFALRGFDRWPEQLLPAFALTLGCSMAIATASWWLIEKPAIAWAHRRTPSRGRGRRPALAGAGAGD